MVFYQDIGWYQSACNTKLIHNQIVDKRAFNLFLIFGIHAENRKHTGGLACLYLDETYFSSFYGRFSSNTDAGSNDHHGYIEKIQLLCFWKAADGRRKVDADG